MKKQLVFVAYDISDARLERLLIKELERSGVRYQYSILICTISKEDLPGLTKRIQTLYNTCVSKKNCATFRVSLLPVCSLCFGERVEIGKGFGNIQGSLVI